MPAKGFVLPSAVIGVSLCLLAAVSCARVQHDAPAAQQSAARIQQNPLIRAAAAGEPEEVRRLLDLGADVHARSAVPHEATAMTAALYHSQNDIERIIAVPNDPGGESMRNQPMDSEGALKDENYREVIGMLRQAAKDKTAKDDLKKHRNKRG